MKRVGLEEVWISLTNLQKQAGRAIVAGIGGGECSGKSYLVSQLGARASGSAYDVSAINMDGYLRYSREQRQMLATSGSDLKTRSIRIGDHPDCFDLQHLAKDICHLMEDGCLERPFRYDYSLGRVVRDSSCICISKFTILAVEGIFALDEALLEIYDFTIYLDTDLQVVWQRYLQRHLGRKTGDAASIKEVFQGSVLPAYMAYIEPTRRNARLVGALV